MRGYWTFQRRGRSSPVINQEKTVRIGELAEAAGTTTKTLRFYEDQGLLPPAERTAAGYRDYTPDALARVDFIHRGRPPR